MSNFSPRNPADVHSRPARTKLGLTKLSLAGEGTWPDLHFEDLAPQLNVFYGPPSSGKSSLAHLVGHLLYGKSESPWRRQFGQTVATTAGTLHLEGSIGNIVLRRHRDGNRHEDSRPWRLTIASEQGEAVDSQTLRTLLSDHSLQIAPKLLSVDFSESPRVDWLLREHGARELPSSREVEKRPSAPCATGPCAAGQFPATDNLSIDHVDRRRVDELVQQRDAIASSIEQQLSVQRRESEVLLRELSEVDAALESKREQARRLQAQLHRLAAELADLETRLRYFSLEDSGQHDGAPVDIQQQQSDLAEIDDDIASCRQTLTHYQQRENLLRSELAQASSDGTADSVTCLADGRATLGVLEQLLNDLDAEVSQLARSSQPSRCITHDAHAKISPVAALLRQQVYTLCGQLTEQERIVRRQQLSAELRQLTRVHTELGQRLELLLSRRESLIGRSQRAAQPLRLVPQPPAREHCHCEHHGEFVQSSATMVLGRADRGKHEAEARSRLHRLENEQTQRNDELSETQHEIDQLQRRWKHLQQERGGLIGGVSIDEKQAELERLESVIRQSLQATDSTPRSASLCRWRASDILAQLTDGQFVQIRLDRQHAEATIVDRNGRPRALESLSRAEHDQLYLALTLSLVSAYADQGVCLPLILDEPFLQQSPAKTAAMAGLLHEFARSGHQLLVFTEDRAAQRRFASLGARCFDLAELRQEGPTESTQNAQWATRYGSVSSRTTDRPGASVSPEESTTPHATGRTRIVRETLAGDRAPVLRLATPEAAHAPPATSNRNASAAQAPYNIHASSEAAAAEPWIGDSQRDDQFYLTEASSFSDFPLLGTDTSPLLQQAGIRLVADLLAADSTRTAEQLSRQGITADTVRLWQIHIGLMCHIPHLTLDDAQVLAAAGVTSPDDLFDLDLEVKMDALLQSIEACLRSQHGSRFASSRGRYTRARLSGWHRDARRYRDRWQRSSRRYSGWQARRRPAQRPSVPAERRSDRSSQRRDVAAPRKPIKSASRPSRRLSRGASRSRRKFYLSREQDVEAAPSIGPKTATRLAKVGIRTIADLLNADPESTAAELDVRHIRPTTIAAWQHQSRLVCQIPQLRGFAAQLLVACELTQPGQIAAMDPDALVEQIQSFCDTKEGQRILRSGDAPEPARIAGWVESANHARPLEAA